MGRQWPRREQFLYPKPAKPQDGLSKIGLRVQKLLISFNQNISGGPR